MKVLMISTDIKILEEGSAVRARMIEYGSICEELNIIIPVTHGNAGKINIAGNVSVFPAVSFNKIFALLKTYRIGVSILATNYQLPTTNHLATSQDAFENGFIAWLISGKTGAKLELQIHTDFLSPYFAGESLLNKIRVFLAGFLLTKAGSIRVVSKRIAVSLQTANYKLRTVPVILPVFVDIDKIRRTEPKINLREKYPQFSFIVLMTSRLTKEKNIELALSAFLGLIKKYPKAGLVIVGSGPEEKNLKLLTMDYGLWANVVFESWQDDVISYYKTADVFINTSNYEGFGMSLIEAATSDCPIISTDVGLVGSILSDNEEASVCPVGDAVCLHDEIEHLIDYPARRKELTLRAQTAVEPLLITKEVYLARMKDCWEDAVGVTRI